MKGLLTKRWWSALLLVAAGILLYKVVAHVGTLWAALGQLLGILAPFIGGFVVAFLLYRPVNAMEKAFVKCRWKVISRPARMWSILAAYLGLAGLVALALVVILPVVIQGVTGLINSLPNYYKTLMAFLGDVDAQEGIVGSLNIPALLEGVYGFIREKLTGQNIIGYLSSILSITSSFLNAVIALIISIYMLSGRERLLATLRRLGEAFLPERLVKLTSHYSRKTADIFSRYVYSMLIDAACVIIILIPGLYISGIPYPLAFAVFIGIANLIPYFGAIISGSISVLVLLLGGHWGMAIFLAIYILVLQQLDGNILQPRIYGQSVGIDPIYVLLAITVGGGIAGFVGMLIGVPVVAVLKMLVSDWIGHRNRVKQEKAAKASEE
ncbi:MAG: AI-2E family transporter [Clostridia bacterium]|nr:AI-2E family transporter [Clostridia bacterium]